MHSHSHGESDNYTCIGPLSSILTHFRYLTTLRSSSRTAEYHSIVIFRLSAPSDASLLVYAMESTCPHLGADMSHADIEESGLDVVAVCPWHRYDFNLKTGQSETGLKACTFDVQIRPSGDERQQSYVWIENPGAGTWEIVEIRPVSEEFADPPDLSKLTINEAKSDLTGPTTLTSDHNQEPNSLLEFAILVLNTADPEQKVEKTRQAVAAFRTGKIKSVGRNTTLRPPDVPPRHDLRLVAPGKVTKRGKAGSVKSRIAILHALANIEQWAIDLAWDMIARFGNTRFGTEVLPNQFFLDWIKVAEDEAKHFSLLRRRLEELGSFYGAHTIHAGLWASARQTAQSLSARLCIIHLVHEARGLDVNPTTIAKFRAAGDFESVKTLEIIHHDEITHVTAGHRWFTFVCEKEGVDPVQTFRAQVKAHFAGALKGPFNEEDRRKAGMTPDFYEDLRGELNSSAIDDDSVGREGNVEINYESPEKR